MEKNENGLPRTRQMTENGGGTNNSTTQSPSPDASGNNGMNNGSNGRMNNGTNGMMNNGCGEMTDNCLDALPLTYVYAPNQRFCMLYSATDALDHGTLFEALYKPMEVYGRE